MKTLFAAAIAWSLASSLALADGREKWEDYYVNGMNVRPGQPNESWRKRQQADVAAPIPETKLRAEAQRRPVS
jgi:hypothetical protein